MQHVRSGLDRFLEPASDLAGLGAGARVGLLAHAATVDSAGRHAVALFDADARLELVRLFAPEHGIFGEAQDMESVDDLPVDERGRQTVSLYGESPESLRPRPEQLEGLDGVICDLQDVGSRYYTFVYTIAYVMEACGEAGIPVIVLDRPNPIGGEILEGPVLDPTLASFVGRFPLPVRHAMTPGELARWFAAEIGIACDLRVVPMSGWKRSMDFEATGLPWIHPSPNMPTVDTAFIYPGGCLIEGTRLSEGRGTTRPFELVGAPWLPAGELATRMSALNLPGLMFVDTRFRPMFQKHAGQSCAGVQIVTTDRRSVRSFAAYIALIREARRLAGDAFDWRREAYEFETERLAIDLLLGRHELRPMLESDASLKEIEASWQPALEAFAAQRTPHLLYD